VTLGKCGKGLAFLQATPDYEPLGTLAKGLAFLRASKATVPLLEVLPGRVIFILQESFSQSKSI
jgi:hypothetical protein